MSLRLAFAAVALAAPLLAGAGTFSVSPVRVDLSGSAKTGSVTVTNDGAPLQLRVSLMRWTQDGDGRDVYEPSSDLVYFPREASVAQGAQRIVRAALNSAPGEVERAYRLYIEELPGAVNTPANGSRIAVLVRFGVPVYVAARNPQHAVAFDAELAAPGTVRLRNTGNSHLRLESLQARGAQLEDIEARYLLPGAALAVKVSAVQCSQPTAPSAIVHADEGTFTVPLPAALCPQ